MAEEHRLILTLVPKVDTVALRDATSGTFSGETSTNSPQQAAGGSSTSQNSGSGGGGGGGSSDHSGSTVETADGSGSSSGSASSFGAFARVTNALKRGITSLRKKADSDDDGDDKDERKNEIKKKLISMGVEAGTAAFKQISQTALGLISDIYKQMRNASPLLQAIESLFNLAVTLFFMPLGNKLGDMLIPATIDLLDKVTDIWDAFEGESLSDMLSYALSEGTKIFAQYIHDIADTLEGQEGILGSLAKFLNMIANFVENKLEGFLNGLLNFAGWILEHFKEFISLYVAMSTAQLGATIGSSFWYGPWGPLLGAGIGGGIGYGVTYSALTAMGIPHAAEGGYFPAQEGGTLAHLAEAGEGEYVIPESKLGQIGGITNNFYIDGVKSDELADIIDERISRQISRSRIQSGF